MYPPISPHSQPPYNQPVVTGFPVGYNGYNLPFTQPQATPPQPKDWSTGLFGCFSNFKNCCITCWCPCVTFGRVAEIVDRGSTSCGASAALYTLILCVTGGSAGCLYSCFYRSKMRAQYKLKKSNNIHHELCRCSGYSEACRCKCGGKHVTSFASYTDYN